MDKLFVYGSLMYEEVWGHLVKGKFDRVQAELEGFKRVNITGETYPAIRKEKGSKVEGILIAGLNSNHFRLLDKFEGKLYKRETVTVLIQLQRECKCEVYLFKNKYRHLLSNSDWCPRNFHEKHLRRFLSSYTS